MFIGYARVSTYDQNLDYQKDLLSEHGCTKIYKDKISGVKKARPGLDTALKYLRENDTLVVWKLDRLGRSTKHLMELSEYLSNNKINLKSLQEGIDTSTKVGQFFFTVLAALAEFERGLIQERTQAGLKAARARGRFGGRPKKLDETKINLLHKLYKEKELSVREIAKAVGISVGTLYNYLED